VGWHAALKKAYQRGEGKGDVVECLTGEKGINEKLVRGRVLRELKKRRENTEKEEGREPE